MLLLAVGLALAFAGWRAATDGRFRGRVQPLDDGSGAAGVDGSAAADTAATSVLEGTTYADQMGERATLLQFSSAFCAPCRATRRTLEEVVGLVDDVAHVEVDAESQLELVRRLGIMRTPTTLVLDGRGREVTRAAGVPTKQQVLAAIGQSSLSEQSGH